MKTGSMRKCAIVAFGMEHCRRGVETHARMLFEKLKSESGLQMTLIKGSGSRSDEEVVLSVPKRHTWLNRFLGKLRGYDIYWEQVFFMFKLGLHLLRNSYDVIYTQEYVHMVGVNSLRSIFGWKLRLVYCEGFVVHSATRLRHADYLQEVNKSNFDYLQSLKRPSSKPVLLIPHFIEGALNNANPRNKVIEDLERFATGFDTLLYVGPTDIEDKNFDSLFQAFLSLSERWRLVICGEVRESRKKQFAKVGERIFTCYIEHQFMPTVYSICDVYVHPALNEPFGIAILEAMSNRLPVLLHDSEHSLWLTGDRSQCVDMRSSEAIRASLESIADTTQHRARLGNRNSEYCEANFNWEKLRPEYVSLFQ